MRRGCLALIAGLVSVLAAAPALAKGPPTVTLDSPAQLQRAAAGQRVTIAWTQDGPAQLPVPDGADVRSLGVYVNLRGASGGPTIRAAARPAAAGAKGFPAGHYSAQAVVPAGGIGALSITVEGLRSRPGATPVPARAVAPSTMLIANDPFTVAAGDADPTSHVPWAALALWSAALALLLATARRARAARRPAT